jgi:hypothetical protein
MLQQCWSIQGNVAFAGNGTYFLPLCEALGQQANISRKFLRSVGRLQASLIKEAEMRDLIPRRPAMEVASCLPLRQCQGLAQLIQRTVFGEKVVTNFFHWFSSSSRHHLNFKLALSEVFENLFGPATNQHHLDFAV